MANAQQIQQGLLAAAQNYDLAALNTILLSTSKSNFARMDSDILKTVLQSIIDAPTAAGVDNALFAETLGIFVKQVDVNADALSLSMLFSDLGKAVNTVAMDAILDNTSAGLASLMKGNFIGAGMAWMSNFGTDWSAMNQTTEKVMDVFGSKITNMSQFEMTTAAYGYQGNYWGVNAVVNNMTADQFDTFATRVEWWWDEYFGVSLLTSGSDSFTGAYYKALYGGGGNDTFDFTNNTEEMNGDMVFGNGGDDSFLGSAHADYFMGDKGRDTLRGNDGDDILAGGTGIDILYGGAGADTFVFVTGDVGRDAVRDFNAAEGDKIDISDLLQDFDPMTDALSEFVKVIKNSKSISTLQVDANGAEGGVKFVSVAIFSNTAPLDAQQLLTDGNLVV